MSLTALVIDDERDIRELLVLTLGRMGLRVAGRRRHRSRSRAVGQRVLLAGVEAVHGGG